MQSAGSAAIGFARAQSSRLAVFGGLGMSFNICRGTLGSFAMLTAIRNASSRESRFAAAGTFAQLCGNHRAAASALSSGRVLKAMVAPGAPLWTALTTDSNTARP
jgi:hypothetical protein